MVLLFFSLRVFIKMSEKLNSFFIQEQCKRFDKQEKYAIIEEEN